MSRKLASIQRVVGCTPISGADRIESAQVLGWQVVVPKGAYSAGDLCIYLEIDSVPPDTDAFRFLWAKPGAPASERPGNYRLKSKRMRGALSQGCIFPTSILPDGTSLSEGLDVSDILGVVKWETPSTEVGDPYPTHILPKTDEIRIQSMPEILEELRGVECYSTVKADGSSMTVLRHDLSEDSIFQVCSRNFALHDVPGCQFWKTARAYGLHENLPMNFAVQGELVGPGIQKNRLGLDIHKFLVFSVYHITTRTYLGLDALRLFCTPLGLEMVEIDDEFIMNTDVGGMLQKSSGFYSGSGLPREGIVVRPRKPVLSQALSAYNGKESFSSFKVISNEYLLSGGD